MSKKPSKTSDAKAKAKQIASLQSAVKGAKTPEDQKAALDALNAAQPGNTLSSLKVQPIDSSTAWQGSKTSGTTIGDAREIRAAQIDPVTNAQTTHIGPVERVTAPDLGTAAQSTAAVQDPTTNYAASTIDRSGDAEYRAQQMALARGLEARAAGTGPSIASLQLQQAFDRMIANQRSAAMAVRGINPALAARMAALQAGDTMQQTAMQTAIARIQEQNDAAAQLGTVVTQGRTADQAIAGAQATLNDQAAAANAAAANRRGEVNAGLVQQTSLANQAATNQRTVDQADYGTRTALANQLATNTAATNQASLDQQVNLTNAGAANTRAVDQAQIDQQAAIANQNAVNTRNIDQGQIAGGISQAGIAAAATEAAAQTAANAGITIGAGNNQAGVTEAAIQAGTATNNAGAAGTAAGQNAATGAQAGVNSNNAGIVGSVINAGGAAITGGGADIRSDKRAKKGILPAADKMQDFLDKLGAAQFEYKNKKRDGKGKQFGVMAQDLEKSEVGKTLVKEDSGGKMIDFKRGLGAVLAAQASINKRMAALEARK